jgi:hypothetical protein
VSLGHRRLDHRARGDRHAYLGEVPAGQVSSEIESELPIEGKQLYKNTAERIRDRVGLSARRAIPTDAVVQAVLHALTAKRPKTRYLVGTDAKIRAIMVKWLPDRLQDWILKKVLQLP